MASPRLASAKVLPCALGETLARVWRNLRESRLRAREQCIDSSRRKVQFTRASIKSNRCALIVLVPRARLSIFAKFHRGRDDEDPPALLARSGHGIVANLAPNADLLGNLVKGDFALELPDSANRESR